MSSNLSCSNDSHSSCPPGEHCYNFVCARNEAYVDPSAVAKHYPQESFLKKSLDVPCRKNAECQTHFCSPFTGLCTKPYQFGQTCSSDMDCTVGTCKNNYCLPRYIGETTYPEYHCGNQICYDFQYCSSVGWCAGRWSGGATCHSDAECLDGFLCHDGRSRKICYAFVDAKFQCDPGESCVPLVDLNLRGNRVQGLCLRDADYSAVAPIKPVAEWLHENHLGSRAKLSELLHRHTVPSAAQIAERAEYLQTAKRAFEAGRAQRREERIRAVDRLAALKRAREIEEETKRRETGREDRPKIHEEYGVPRAKHMEHRPIRIRVNSSSSRGGGMYVGFFIVVATLIALAVLLWWLLRGRKEEREESKEELPPSYEAVTAGSDVPPSFEEALAMRWAK